MVADGLDVDFERLDVCGGDELMFQGYEQYDDGSCHGSAQSGKELAAFQLGRHVAFTAGEQNGEDVKHDDTARIDHNLYRTEERISQQEVDACRAEKHEQQVCGRTYHASGGYRQYGEYADEGRKEVKYYCFKIKFHVIDY